jgi:hypothetical protein
MGFLNRAVTVSLAALVASAAIVGVGPPAGAATGATPSPVASRSPSPRVQNPGHAVAAVAAAADPTRVELTVPEHRIGLDGFPGVELTALLDNTDGPTLTSKRLDFLLTGEPGFVGNVVAADMAVFENGSWHDLPGFADSHGLGFSYPSPQGFTLGAGQKLELRLRIGFRGNVSNGLPTAPSTYCGGHANRFGRPTLAADLFTVDTFGNATDLVASDETTFEMLGVGVRVRGLPGQITAGAEPVEFALEFCNPSGSSYGSLAGRPRPRIELRVPGLHPAAVVLEVFDRTRRTWQPVQTHDQDHYEDNTPPRAYLNGGPLAAHSTATLRLRVGFRKSAPARSGVLVAQMWTDGGLLIEGILGQDEGRFSVARAPAASELPDTGADLWPGLAGLLLLVAGGALLPGRR